MFIQEITLKNFRNFHQKQLSFEKNNYIQGENGKGKTNILEAISIFDMPLVDLNPDILLKKGEKHLYVEIVLNNGKKISFAYDQESSKKKYSINGKATTKKKIREIVPKVVSFHPMEMNMMYLGPSRRRDFVDTILSRSFPKYGDYLKQYKKIVTSRNKLLKNISEGKSDESELDFWDKAFITSADNIYSYRKKLIDFFKERVDTLPSFFNSKISKAEFTYISKCDIKSPKEELKKYLEKNRVRDIFLRKTPIGPHVDDFNIIVDEMNLADFGSRGEVKSCIIQLKLIEADFISQQTQTQPIFLVDDLMSELDNQHRDMIFTNIEKVQTFITSIHPLEKTGNNIFL